MRKISRISSILALIESFKIKLASQEYENISDPI